MKELVSIIVPVYNCSKSICRCVDSILNQTYGNLEVLLINDGSTDSSGEICEHYAEKDQRVCVVHQSNAGVSQARNTGLKRATAKYVMFVDSDDYLKQNYIEVMAREIVRENIDLVISGYTIVKDSVEVVHKEGEKAFYNQEDFGADFGKLYKEYYLHVVWNKIFLRDKIVEEFPTGMSLGEDCVFVLSYLNDAEGIKLIDNTGYFYVTGQQNSLTNKFRKDTFEANERVYVETMNYLKNIKCASINAEIVAGIFMDDVSKALWQICKSNTMKWKEKRTEMKKIADSEEFQSALRISESMGKRQQVILTLLSKYNFVLVRSLYAFK